MGYETDQERFWAGAFGDSYLHRNTLEKHLAARTAMWARMVRAAHDVHSAREFGCNIGLNLLALRNLRTDVALSGIEINKTAAEKASQLNVADIRCGTILESVAEDPVDLTFTVGVLIHINPDNLDRVYDNLVSNTRRYVLIAEYYNPMPVSVEYRGHADRLFKRDFAGELIDRYNLKLVDYGFIYKRDHWAPQDDVNWFLLEK